MCIRDSVRWYLGLARQCSGVPMPLETALRKAINLEPPVLHHEHLPPERGQLPPGAGPSST
eukprot:10935300-Prorocentrum_lima.AAC.1